MTEQDSLLRWYEKALDDRASAQAEVERLRGLITDGEKFWNAIYPHTTERGPDLTLADCHEICRWLTASESEALRR